MPAPEICLFHSHTLPTPPPLSNKKTQFRCQFVMIAFCNLMGFLMKGKPVGVFIQMFSGTQQGISR